MVKKINKADKLVFKALQRAVADNRLHLCLINSRINVPGSPVYNPWEVLLPALIPVLLGLTFIWVIGILWGLAFMIAGIMLSSNLVKKKLEQRLFDRTKEFLVSSYKHCEELWSHGGVVLLNADDKKHSCVSPDGNWQEFIILNFADLMTDKSATTSEKSHEKVA